MLMRSDLVDNFPCSNTASGSDGVVRLRGTSSWHGHLHILMVAVCYDARVADANASGTGFGSCLEKIGNKWSLSATRSPESIADIKLTSACLTLLHQDASLPLFPMTSVQADEVCTNLKLRLPRILSFTAGVQFISDRLAKNKLHDRRALM